VLQEIKQTVYHVHQEQQILQVLQDVKIVQSVQLVVQLPVYHVQAVKLYPRTSVHAQVVNI